MLNLSGHMTKVYCEGCGEHLFTYDTMDTHHNPYESVKVIDCPVCYQTNQFGVHKFSRFVFDGSVTKNQFGGN